ncbi:MAG: methionine aminotransferase [Bacteroidetes bacterium]|nr:methionine aminotransferase [Bacteroidota bacterium]
MNTYQNLIQSKLPSVGTTIFSTMSKLAQEHQAINLSQGFPDFSCSEKLTGLVTHYMNKGFNQYAPMPGAMPLREQVSQMVHDLYGHFYNPDTEITITAGATQAIYTAISALVREGDEVIVFEPAYDCYVPAIEINGGKPIYVQLQQPDFSIDWSSVKKMINHRTKMIIINTPHNPSGSTLSEKDMDELEKLVTKTDLLILSDEVYEHICFAPEIHQSVARYKNLVERSILVSSFGKTVHTTGWKVGYVCAPTNIMNEFRKVHQFLVFSVNHPVQLALSDFLKEKDNYLEVKDFYAQKRNYFLKLIKGSRFHIQKSSGTYFQLLRYNAISSEKDTDFAIRLTQEKKIAAIPLSAFYHEKTDNKILRFCFAKKEETLEKAAEILMKI